MGTEVAYEIDGRMVSEADYKAHEKEARQAVVDDLVKMRDRWVRHRSQSGVEARWRKARMMYFGVEEGKSSLEETLTVGPAPKRGPQEIRSRVVINIVRPKVDQAVARMCEILLPIDDRNWGMKPTPVPESISKLVNKPNPTIDPRTGQPTGLTADQEAQAIIRAAKEMCEGMEQVIDDQLTECQYNGVQRRGIEYGVMLGSMVLKGPFPTQKISKTWSTTPDGVSTLVIEKSVTAASIEVDPWDIFFDPACGNNHQRGAGAWHRKFVTRKELRALRGQPGFDDAEIDAVLRTPPNRVRVAEGRVTRAPTEDDSYELWEYHGEIEPDQMARCSAGTGMDSEVDFGVLMLVNDHCVGAMPSWVEDGALPYDVWCWRKADDSPFGYGLCDELEHQQGVVTAAWRQVMDNARNSGGSQIVMKRKGLSPAVANDWRITPQKLWFAGEEIDDVRKVFSVFDFPSHIQEMLMIVEAAMKYADQESSMPQMMGGEKGTAPETLGGMIMLFNNANVVLRQRVKLYDDDITRPHISRYNDWNMANSDDPSIKGDCEVDARGSTALLEKDIQNQATMNLAGITSNPRYAKYIDEVAELKLILKAFRIQPKDLLKPEDEIEKIKATPEQAPPDPRIEASKMMLQAKQLDLQNSEAQRAFEAQRNAGENAIRMQTLEYNRDREASEYEISMTDSSIQRDLAMLKLENDGQLTREQIAAKERLEALKIDAANQRFNAESALRVQTGQGI